MNKLLWRHTAAVLLSCFLLLPAPAWGQGIGVYSGRQGRRVGRVTLPTPPFNPNAGILDGRKGRVKDSPRAASRRSTPRGLKAAKRKTAHRTTRKRGV